MAVFTRRIWMKGFLLSPRAFIMKKRATRISTLNTPAKNRTPKAKWMRLKHLTLIRRSAHPAHQRFAAENTLCFVYLLANCLPANIKTVPLFLLWFTLCGQPFYPRNWEKRLAAKPISTFSGLLVWLYPNHCGQPFSHKITEKVGRNVYVTFKTALIV